MTSPGVKGVLTAGAALERLLGGTGLRFRTVTPGALELTIAVAPEVVDVTGRLSPYRPIESTSATKTDTPLRDIPQTLTVVPEPLLVDQQASPSVTRCGTCRASRSRREKATATR